MTTELFTLFKMHMCVCMRYSRHCSYNYHACFKVFVTLQTTHAPRNRSWKESENGLLLPEDHTIEYKKRELQAERKREYNEHLAQVHARTPVCCFMVLVQNIYFLIFFLTNPPVS